MGCSQKGNGVKKGKEESFSKIGQITEHLCTMKMMGQMRPSITWEEEGTMPERWPRVDDGV